MHQQWERLHGGKEWVELFWRATLPEHGAPCIQTSQFAGGNVFFRARPALDQASPTGRAGKAEVVAGGDNFATARAGVACGRSGFKKKP
jgi:hypothetical protein